ncbi:MAG: RNA polymerase subunit sigma-24 [Chlorobiaceae bacterium]|nr:RNA polymerase subunit sigma-24 [Chlorobiaceae bacterium]
MRFEKSISFEELVKLHQDQVLNTCFRFVNNKEDAEDLAQDVFMEVYHSIDSFRGDAKLSSWIYRIAVNKSLDFIRKKKRKKRFAFVLSLAGFGDEEQELQLPVTSNPHTDLEQKERTQILNKAIDLLSENQKVAITLSKYEGLSNKEIAEIMGTSVSAVDSLIHRAKNNLQKKLHKFMRSTYEK